MKIRDYYNKIKTTHFNFPSVSRTHYYRNTKKKLQHDLISEIGESFSRTLLQTLQGRFEPQIKTTRYACT